VSRRRPTRPRLRSRRAHEAHQPLDPLAIDGMAIASQHLRHPPRAQEEPRREQLIDPTHQRQIVIISRRWRPVHVRTRNPEQLTLPADRQRWMRAVEPCSAVRNAHLPDLFAKKSRSTINCPILACSFSISRSRLASASWPAPSPSKARAACSSSCFSRHKSGWGELHSAAPDRPRSLAPAPLPRRSSPSAPRLIVLHCEIEN
jgi:hypothetical protein